jgi:hypothetical protein
MDMGGNDDNVTALTTRFPHARVVRYYDNHLSTLKRCISRCRTPYAWVISSVCDYESFDFSYHAVPWEAYQLHCWASDEEKFGDTFLVNVSEFNKQQDIPLLEWYKDVNWHSSGVPRLLVPVVTYTSDNLIDIVKATQFNTPYVLFKRDYDSLPNFTPVLWRNRSVHTFNRANSVSLVPREIMAPLETQIYDYPYIIKQKEQNLGDKPLDIIYISYGEKIAETNYNHLMQKANRSVKRVDNVSGRVTAYHTAAKLSETEWFFLVPAKLEVDGQFDWDWQPDYLQEPKHYIFNALNPVNGLEYGHMAVIAYNRQLVLETDGSALDFALSKLHTSIPLVSGTARYDTDELIVWRTAFREVIKLKQSVDETNSIESTYRLNVWLTESSGPYANWSIYGAKDAVEFYNEVNGNYDKLMYSFNWDWLAAYFNTRYQSKFNLSM